MPLFELNEVICLHWSHVHMGSVFSLDLVLFYILIFSNPQMTPRRDNGFAFPPELTQLIQ